MKYLVVFLIVVIVHVGHIASGQYVHLSQPMASQFIESEAEILTALDTLFAQLNDNRLDEKLIREQYGELTKSILGSVQNTIHEKTKKGYELYVYLVNSYPVSKNTVSISLVISGNDSSDISHAGMMLELIAEMKNEKFQFSIPLQEKTTYYRTTRVGKITYHHRGKLDLNNARKFDKKNETIASKMGVPAESFEFFMCDHYQEILNLLGIVFDADEIGKYRNGYGVDGGCIFSIMNHEDFSHDIVHYYSGKINKRKDRNWITEEGVAYSWGNAYYTDNDGDMIDQSQLVTWLARYIKSDSRVNLLEIFEKNVRCFEHLAPEVSGQSVISGLICDEVERYKGMDGIFKLINCGGYPRLDNFLQATDELVGINRENFNRRVMQLIEMYAK